ncbi:MAG: SpoIIE family protein phosphatase, partial [Chloroflexota bacterium]
MPPDDLNLLRSVPFFAGVQPEALDLLEQASHRVTFQPGEDIMCEGDLEHSMWVVLSGEVEIYKSTAGQVTVLSRRGVGEIVGEMAFFEARPRSASVRAVQTCRMMEITESRLRSALLQQPELLFHAAQMISGRLRQSQDALIADLQAKNQALQQAYHELQAAQAALIEKERLERELELAHELQQSFLPAEFPSLAGFACAARSRPARQVGGDFYDVIDLGERQVGLVMADVSDKGITAALFMALSRSLIRAEARRGRSPCEVLGSVNRLLIEISPTTMFVTVFYGLLDLNTHRLRYVRAGHDRPLLFRAAQGCCDFLNARGMMLGLMEPIELEEMEAQLAPGDQLVLYTDGVTDANSPQGEFFGA